ncbi:MAG TPA: tetratricopeptide repeat protein [Thermoanaerobaculia bacterium]|nr:tetratricopeptide repeat protein [Thermoanaerobaculia bacterium]
MNRPVVFFFAFANDRDDRARYLRNLPEEQRRVREAVAEAVKAGHCEVVERNNATADDIFDVLQDPDYRDRVAVFHYGGHAGGGELVLETPQGAAEPAHAGGLARFLGEQRGLALVFLNGCSSRGQVQGLLDAGVPAVVATSQAIDDAVATEFAARFYQALAGGASLRTAYAEAQGAVQTRRGGLARDTYRSFVPEAMAEERWPWDLHVAPGAEERVARWSLPLAARDPLFGLPPPPALDLPSSPFKHLAWFTREDAEVFFGRGQEIRDLYEAVTLPEAAPIVLLFGATGVGKSSLLAAGLAPRLEATHEVVYARRDGAGGLAATLARALGAAGGAGAPADLGAAWRAREKASGKPLVVILDQAEEVWTRPLAGGREAEELAAALRSIFAVRETRPRGRLLLGFRKEWLAEVLRLVDGEALPRLRVEVTHLGCDAIAEAVAGPASSERLRRHYGLEVEPELPGIVADDLLEDPGAAVAPALQILLTKMWTLAAQESPGAPRFTVALYQRLKRGGILLDDFVGEQHADLRRWRSQAVDSGLALDLLGHHTTAVGTAETRQAAAVAERYGGRAEVKDLLGQCNDRYLLSVAEGATRLAHDTLAPLVRRRLEASDLPGQRASRILEQRAVEWAGGKEGAPLDEMDLTIVEQGADGMRAWTADEKRLVERSRDQRTRRRRLRRNLRWAATLAVLVIATSAAAAWWQRARAEKEARTAGRVTDFLAGMFQELDPYQVALDENSLPHILERSQKRIDTDLAGEPAAQDELRATIGVVYSNLGLVRPARKLLEQVVAFRRRALGEEHRETLQAKSDLANVYSAAARYQEAEKLYREVLAGRRRVLGEEHADTIKSMGNLANVSRHRGRLKEAEGLNAQVVELFRRVQGDRHPDTLKAMTNLANLYAVQGRLRKAEDLHRRVLQIRRGLLRPGHPDTLASMTSLANVVSARGRPQEAEELHRRAFEISRGVLGKEHPDTLMYLENLANARYEQGRLDEAETLYRQVLALRRRLQGAEHPDTIASMNNLAVVAKDRNRPNEAEELLRRGLEIHRRVLGPEHPATLTSMANLAVAYAMQDRLAAAEDLQRRTLALQRRVLDEHHPDALRSINNLAAIVGARGRAKEAEGLLRQALALLRSGLGEEHPDALRAMNHLAGVVRGDGRLGEAEGLYRQTLARFRRGLGEEHPDTIWSLSNLAAVVREQGRLTEAEALYLELLALQRRTLGEQHIDTLTTMNHLAGVYRAQGRLQEAEGLENQALALYQRRTRPPPPSPRSAPAGSGG